jgi:hypothetical protein
MCDKAVFMARVVFGTRQRRDEVAQSERGDVLALEEPDEISRREERRVCI